MYGSIFIQICAVGSKKHIFSAPECVLAIQGGSGSSKVDDFGTNRKCVYDFGTSPKCVYDFLLVTLVLSCTVSDLQHVLWLITEWCYSRARSVVMRLHVVRPSVCPSVTF